MKRLDHRAALQTIRGVLDDEWRAEISHLARTTAGWGRTYRTTRLRCGSCEAGYMVYSRTGAFCSEGCGFTMRRPEYVAEKCYAVKLILGCGVAYPQHVWPFFRIEDRRRRRPTEATRASLHAPTIANENAL